MTAPSYTEDLSDLSAAESATGWAEATVTIGGEAYDANGPAAGADGDYPYIQGSYAVTQDCTKDTSVGSLVYNNGSGTGGHGTDGAYFVWQNYMVSSNLGTYAQGGLQIYVGSSLAAGKVWYVGGVDKSPYPYGGWVNNVCNTTVTADGSDGTPTATEQYIGSCVYVAQGSSKGEVHNVDFIRYGRGSAIFEYGETADYATIAGFAAQNDNSSNRWGLIQATSGGYLWKGRMSLGTATNAVDFRDSNKIIFVQWTPKVTANFNTIEVINADSNIEMTGFQFICLDTTTVSQGRWITTNNATVALDGCTFIDMSTFAFDTNTAATDCTWRRCGQITAAGADLTGSAVSGYEGTAGTGAVNWNVATDPDGYLDNMTITKGTASTHAIEFGTSAPTSITIRGLTASGYNASDTNNDSTFYVARTTGDVTISCIGCTGNMTYRSAGANVTIVNDPVTVKVTVTNATGTEIENARVFLKASSGTGPFPYQDTVTISNSGTTATVTHTAHGMATNDYVSIEGGTIPANDGVFQITLDGVDPTNKYTYTMGSTPGASPTGTITSTFVALYGLTNASGVASTSRVYSSAQPVTGWARKSSGSPYYKPGSVSGSVSASEGFTGSAVLTDDE